MGQGKRSDMIVHTDQPYNAEPPRRALSSKPLTPLDAFYSRNHGAIPSIDTRGWRLIVDGLVGNPLNLSLSQLRDRFTEQSLVATLQCAGNRRKEFLAFRDIPDEVPWGSTATSTAEWTGVRLSDVLEAADLLSEAGHIEFLGPDIAEHASPPQPFGSSIPVQKATAGEVLVAWAMNGEPLPSAHGGPVRIVVPGYIGARSVKWVHGIRALTAESRNYFQAVAYRLEPADADRSSVAATTDFALGAVALNSDILSPDDGDLLPSGPTTVTGYAFAGDGRGISRVEVSGSAGRCWHEAALDDELGPWAWRRWQITVDLPVGQCQILARAWDASGDTQPEFARDLWNPKGYGNNSWGRVNVTAA